jgi:hypothetical protein
MYGRHTVSKVFEQLAHFLVENQVQLVTGTQLFFMCNFDEDNSDFVGGMLNLVQLS